MEQRIARVLIHADGSGVSVVAVSSTINKLIEYACVIFNLTEDQKEALEIHHFVRISQVEFFHISSTRFV